MSVGRLTTSGKSRVNLTDQIDSHKNHKESNESGRQTARRLIIFRSTCTPAILFWVYSYSDHLIWGICCQIFWRIRKRLYIP